MTEDKRQDIILYVKIGVSAAMFLTCVLVLLLSADDGRAKWAIGGISLVVGYWLK